jgi:hypothetical protein
VNVLPFKLISKHQAHLRMVYHVVQFFYLHFLLLAFFSHFFFNPHLFGQLIPQAVPDDNAVHVPQPRLLQQSVHRKKKP